MIARLTSARVLECLQVCPVRPRGLHRRASDQEHYGILRNANAQDGIFDHHVGPSQGRQRPNRDKLLPLKCSLAGHAKWHIATQIRLCHATSNGRDLNLAARRHATLPETWASWLPDRPVLRTISFSLPRPVPVAWEAPAHQCTAVLHAQATLLCPGPRTRTTSLLLLTGRSQWPSSLACAHLTRLGRREETKGVCISKEEARLRLSPQLGPARQCIRVNDRQPF